MRSTTSRPACAGERGVPMSAERRRRKDSLPGDEWTANPQVRPDGGQPGEAWSAEFQHEPGPRGGGQDQWPGDSLLDQAWASSYRFDGRPSDEPWRDPGQRGDRTPADQAWRHDTASGDQDDWLARPQADQSWRYRSLADDTQRPDGAEAGWPGPGPAAGAGRNGGQATGRRASDNWPASARSDEGWRESTHAGQGRDADGYYAIPWSGDPAAADGPATDPFATDLYAGDYASGGLPSGTHVVGGRRGRHRSRG